VTTTLWYTRCPAPTAASIAIRQGWLEEEFAADGIAVRSISEALDEPTRLAHYSHDHPALFRFGGYVPPLQAMARGVDLRIIGLNWHDRVAGFFTLPDHPLAARRAEGTRALAGARLALPIRKHDRTDWWRATVLAGIAHLRAISAPGDAAPEIVPIEIERSYFDDATTGPEARASLWGSRSQFAVQREEVAALYRGEVDAIYSDAALAAILTATTGAIPLVLLKGYEDDTEAGFGHPIVLTVSARLLKERSDLVDRWVAQLLRAQGWVRANRSETRRIFANDTGLPEALLDHGYSARLPDQVDVSLSSERVALVRRKCEHLLKHGFLERDFDIEAMIDPGPLARLRNAKAA
jgi:ABC-type nitrate/sulfonate/bicarbonate transport system substrate-binding protein